MNAHPPVVSAVGLSGMLVMMRYASSLICLSLLGMLLAGAAGAANITFHGNQVIELARVIAAAADRTNQLPAAYRVWTKEGQPQIITAANAFELCARSITDWSQTKSFPGAVAMLAPTLSGPSPHPQYEPKTTGMQAAMPTMHLGYYTPQFLLVAEKTGTLPTIMKLGDTVETRYQLTPAQYLVAMAILIDESVKRGAVPAAIAVPLVRSPLDWSDIREPVEVKKIEVNADPPPPPDPYLRINLNGKEILSAQPRYNGTPVPYCGRIRMEITGFGPVARVRLAVDNEVQQTFNGIGPHYHALNTLLLPDGQHALTITAYDAQDKSFVYIYSLLILNGRQNGFTPAERDDKEVEAVPAAR